MKRTILATLTLIAVLVFIGFPLNAQEVAPPTATQELADIAAKAAADAIKSVLAERGIRNTAVTPATTESPAPSAPVEATIESSAPVIAETVVKATGGKEWDDKLINIITVLADKAFQGVEVTEQLVKDFLSSPVGILTVSIAVWEITGKDLAALVLGIICVIIALVIVGRTCRNVFFGRRVLVKKDGKLKEYANTEPLYKEDDDAAGIYLVIRAIVFLMFAALGVAGICMGLG